MRIELRIQELKVEAWDDLNTYRNCGESESCIQEDNVFITDIWDDSLIVDGEEIPFKLDHDNIPDNGYIDDRCMRHKYVYMGFAKKHWVSWEIDEDEFDISKLEVVKSTLKVPENCYFGEGDMPVLYISYNGELIFDTEPEYDEEAEEYLWDEWYELWDADFEHIYSQKLGDNYYPVPYHEYDESLKYDYQDFVDDDELKRLLKEEGIYEIDY